MRYSRCEMQDSKYKHFQALQSLGKKKTWENEIVQNFLIQTYQIFTNFFLNEGIFTKKWPNTLNFRLNYLNTQQVRSVYFLKDNLKDEEKSDQDFFWFVLEMILKYRNSEELRILQNHNSSEFRNVSESGRNASNLSSTFQVVKNYLLKLKVWEIFLETFHSRRSASEYVPNGMF
eukprot:TRINITY_DN17165_c0_g1_i3.p2 TRINITY_DN17165_c0_g1~~TRINITY_DN17165_c0_g1_i3.p2  ORF type:complete len:175 (-),score=0.65 TRINITY_DN17165_c0_g1_i3:401-925(-)